MDTMNAFWATDTGLSVRSGIRDLQSDATALAALAGGTAAIIDGAKAQGNARGMIVMDVGAFFMCVVNRMGEDRRKLPDAAYGKEG